MKYLKRPRNPRPSIHPSLSGDLRQLSIRPSHHLVTRSPASAARVQTHPELGEVVELVGAVERAVALLLEVARVGDLHAAAALRAAVALATHVVAAAGAEVGVRVQAAAATASLRSCKM